MLLEFPERLHHALHGTGAGLRDRALVEEVEHLAVVGIEPWLVIVAIEMTHAAAHEEEDHAFRAWRKMWRACGERIGRVAGSGLGCEAREREIAEPAGELLQRATARDQGVNRHGVGWSTD
jgi:hypothetical protein